MNVLIISHNFPPLNVVASYRPYSFARALVDAGCHVTVLTSEKTPDLGDLSLAFSREKLRMVEVPIGAPLAAARVRWAWVLRSAAELRRISRERRVDLIVSSHGPSSSHVLGALASRLWKDAFWVADYRDPWTTGRYERARSPLDPIKHWVERRLVARARLITTVSRGCASNLGGLHTDVPIRVVRNGFDRSVVTTPRPTGGSGPRLITYTGTVYMRNRAAAARGLFDALARLADEGVSPDAIRAVFAGTNLDVIDRLAGEHGVEAFVSTVGMLPRSEAIALQDRSDALLLIEDGEAARQGGMTAKIYEYLAAGVPILVIGPEAQTELGELVAETGTGVCLGADPEAIAAALRLLLQGRARELADPRPEAIARYARARIAHGFVELLRTVGVPLPPGAAT